MIAGIIVIRNHPEISKETIEYTDVWDIRRSQE
jgi:hypothetical protein